ncbi:5-taurinomethyluridine-[tRNA] synthase subunit GTPB3, mitochondrial-like [Glandiceps talaboti]
MACKDLVEMLSKAERTVATLTEEIKIHLADNKRGQRLRSGVHVTIAGPPNAGKSSLLNAICQRPAAIVSSIAGTTRDVVETAVNIGGFPVLLSDTAGLRDTQDVVEQEGVRRAVQRAQQADITIFAIDVNSLKPGQVTNQILENINQLKNGVTEAMESNDDNKFKMADRDEENLQSEWKDDIIVVLNKIDALKSKNHKTVLLEETTKTNNVCVISCLHGDNFEGFLEMLKDKVKQMCASPSTGSPSLTQARHRNHLRKCLQSLSQFSEHEDLVIVAEYLRIALREIGKITGKVGAEEILDVIFKDFCIGK